MFNKIIGIGSLTRDTEKQKPQKVDLRGTRVYLVVTMFEGFPVCEIFQNLDEAMYCYKTKSAEYDLQKVMLISKVIR